MFVKCTTHVMWYIFTYSSHLYVYIHKRIHTHTCAGRAYAYMVQAQTRDLRYISIWQSINTVIESSHMS